jgi:tRNA G26 N,N-dimethylase Trm1
MENKATNIIIENVKINKTIFMESYVHEECLQLLKECHNHY